MMCLTVQFVEIAFVSSAVATEPLRNQVARRVHNASCGLQVVCTCCAIVQWSLCDSSKQQNSRAVGIEQEQEQDRESHLRKGTMQGVLEPSLVTRRLGSEFYESDERCEDRPCERCRKRDQRLSAIAMIWNA